jgi:hypothetical protein
MLTPVRDQACTRLDLQRHVRARIGALENVRQEGVAILHFRQQHERAEANTARFIRFESEQLCWAAVQDRLDLDLEQLGVEPGGRVLEHSNIFGRAVVECGRIGTVERRAWFAGRDHTVEHGIGLRRIEIAIADGPTLADTLLRRLEWIVAVFHAFTWLGIWIGIV